MAKCNNCVRLCTFAPSMRQLVVLLVVMMLLVGCGGGRRAEMRERLQTLNAVNRADTVLTATYRDEAQVLAMQSVSEEESVDNSGQYF